MKDIRNGWGWGGVYFGDPAYENTQHLIFKKKELSKDPLEFATQKAFNTDFCRLRSVVENSFGILKSRFPYLWNNMKGIPYKLAQEFIVSNMVLHNMLLASKSSKSERNKRIGGDQGGEYRSSDFKSFCKDAGVPTFYVFCCWIWSKWIQAMGREKLIHRLFTLFKRCKVWWIQEANVFSWWCRYRKIRLNINQTFLSSRFHQPPRNQLYLLVMIRKLL